MEMSEMSNATESHPTIAKKLYSRDEVATLLGCHLRTVARIDQQRKIPGRILVGKLVKFRVEVIDRWLSGGEQN